MMQAKADSISSPALSLAITFLLIGVSFAVPASLLPATDIKMISDRMSDEVGNVYAIVAWAGLSHFFYAYRGQYFGLRSFAPKRAPVYLLLAIVSLLILWGIRNWLGIGIFGAITWTYFIFHFHKAEVYFEGDNPNALYWRNPTKVILSFAWLSIVLLNVGNIISYPWVIWLFSVGLGCAFLADGGLRQLELGASRHALLSTFFVTEALVWGTVAKYSSPMFLYGVYIFHIAAGSYFHYLGSYFAAFSRSAKKDRLLFLGPVFAINAVFIAIGLWVVNSGQADWLRFLFGAEWFTFWVAAHLVTSDLFPWLKSNALRG